MTKLLIYMLPGIILLTLLMIINFTMVPETLINAKWYSNLMSVVNIACIVVPCVIYYIKMPPGQDTRP